jgi:hypothetical protein
MVRFSVAVPVPEIVIVLDPADKVTGLPVTVDVPDVTVPDVPLAM